MNNKVYVVMKCEEMDTLEAYSVPKICGIFDFSKDAVKFILDSLKIDREYLLKINKKYKAIKDNDIPSVFMADFTSDDGKKYASSFLIGFLDRIDLDDGTTRRELIAPETSFITYDIVEHVIGRPSDDEYFGMNIYERFTIDEDHDRSDYIFPTSHLELIK